MSKLDPLEPALDWRLIVGLGVLLSVLFAIRVPDVDSENIGNWFHARLFVEDFRFINLPKSPLYQLYLVPFSLLPHPMSIVVEGMVSNFLSFLPVAVVMWVCFGRGVGLAASVFAAPDVLQTSPASQAFAFAFICLAFLVRMRRPFEGVSNVNAAYALLLLAWLLRTNTLVVLGVVGAYDLYRMYADRRSKGGPSVGPLSRHWPVPAVVLSIAVMAVAQSPHRWNNYQQIEMTWQPVKGQIGSVISQMVANHYRYRDPKTGGLPFDTYFMHKKFFGDAETITEMVRANPGELVRHAGRNAGGLLTTAVSMTNAGQIGLRFTGLKGMGGNGGPLDHRAVAVVLGTVLAALCGFMVWRLWVEPARRELAVLALGLAAAALVAGLLTNGTSPRILHTVYGLFMIMAAFLAERVLVRFRGLRPVAVFAAFLAVFLVTQGGWARADGAFGWGGVVRKMATIPTWTPGALFYAGGRSRLFETVSREWRHCAGLMTMEMPQHLGAFSTIPRERLFSPFEIPPFGTFGGADYTGLRVDRVNCVYAPNGAFAPGQGSITNIKLRFRSYIGPYMQALIDAGADRIIVPSGVLVIAK